MFGGFKNIHYFCSVRQLHRIAQVEPRSLGASEPKGTPIYINRSASRKYLNYSMNTIEPATEILDCAGIRRMEFGQPSALGMRTCEGKVALAIGRAKG